MHNFPKTILIAAVLLVPSCTRAQNVKTTQAQDIITTQTEVTATERGELTSKDILQSRDISQYDQGGHFDCHGWSQEPKDVCDEKKVRDFIWQHWTDKKRGYIRITYGSVDARSTSHIFIEPEKGQWYIARRIARWQMLPGGGSIVDDILGLTTVERIESKTGNASDWSIVIKRASGKVIYTIPE